MFLLNVISSKKTYIWAYKLIKIIITLFMLVTAYRYFYSLWENRQPIIDIFNSNVLHDANAKNYTPDEMLELLKTKGIDLGIFIGTLIAASIVKGILMRLPVPTFFINEWDKNNDIGTILGRYICSHFRGASYIGHEDWCHLVNYAENQRFYFYKATRNKNLLPLFIKYDDLYKRDFIPTNEYAVNAIKAKDTTPTHKPVQPKSEFLANSHKENIPNTSPKEQSEPSFSDTFNSKNNVDNEK